MLSVYLYLCQCTNCMLLFHFVIFIYFIFIFYSLKGFNVSVYTLYIIYLSLFAANVTGLRATFKKWHNVVHCTKISNFKDCSVQFWLFIG